MGAHKNDKKPEWPRCVVVLRDRLYEVRRRGWVGSPISIGSAYNELVATFTERGLAVEYADQLNERYADGN